MQATIINDGSTVPFTAAADYTAGDVIQLPDGRAGVVVTDVDSGALGSAYVSGRFVFVKTSGPALLDGGRVYWDHSANSATYRKAGDRDFYAGRSWGDAAETAVIASVNLNASPPDDIDVHRDAVESVLVGTAAAGGFGYPVRLGGSAILELTATNEAQKVDLLSVDSFAVGANAIVEGIVRVISDGAGTVVDLSVGVANATHASDADTITESLFVHLDANSTTINAESDDGTTEVAATDTTADYTEGTAFECWFDLRDPTDIQVYVNGDRVLSGSTFKLDAATGPLKLLAHLEKSISTDTYKVAIDALRARFMEQ